MKLKELFEDREAPFKLSQDEFNNLSTPNPNNIEERFKVKDVAFDNVKGFGAVPNNQNVVYMGFAAEMRPSDFLKIALKADRSEDAKKFAEFIKEKAPMGCPFLDVEINEEEWKDGEALRVVVKGHEGRGRMQAIRNIAGDILVPVHFFLRGGMRARNLDRQFFKDLRHWGIVEEQAPKSEKPTKVEFGRFFWDGKEI